MKIRSKLNVPSYPHLIESRLRRASPDAAKKIAFNVEGCFGPTNKLGRMVLQSGSGGERKKIQAIAGGRC